jgi:hypothetical protein
MTGAGGASMSGVVAANSQSSWADWSQSNHALWVAASAVLFPTNSIRVCGDFVPQLRGLTTNLENHGPRAAE